MATLLEQKQDELIELLLRNYTSNHFPMKKETYVRRVRKLRSEISALKEQEKIQSLADKPEEQTSTNGGGQLIII